MDSSEPEIIESDEFTVVARLCAMVNAGALTALVMLIPAALLAGSGHFGESFDEVRFAAILGGSVTAAVLLCLWTPFARRVRSLDDLWAEC